MREELELQLLSELRRAGCFRTVVRVTHGVEEGTAGDAAMLRLNVAIPPTDSPNPIGLIGGDAAGFPNGRRIIDDVVAIELRAIAGIIYPLLDPGFTPDGAAAALTDGTANDVPLLPEFPYLGTPHEGYEHSHD